MFTLIGLALIFVGATAIVSKSILDTFDDDDTPTNPHQLVRLAGSSGAGMSTTEKDEYIKHLHGELTRLKLQSGLPPLWAGDAGDAQGDATPKSLVPSSITPPSPLAITPPNHPPSPIPSPIPSPPPSPDCFINFPLPDMPLDATSNRLKCRDLILRGMTKSEVLEEVWGLTRGDKTGRKESKYYRCSQLFEQIKADTEAEVVQSVRNQLELMGEVQTNGN